MENVALLTFENDPDITSITIIENTPVAPTAYTMINNKVNHVYVDADVSYSIEVVDADSNDLVLDHQIDGKVG